MIKAVIDGGPGTGKTSIIKDLRKKGYNVAPEAARVVLKRKEYRENPFLTKKQITKIQSEIWKLSIKYYQSSLKKRKNHILFFDRGALSGLSYMILSRVKIPKYMIEQAKLILYDYVFIVKPLPKELYVKDSVRRESYYQSLKIHRQIVKSYRKFGYKPIIIPFAPVKKRTEFILQRIRKDLTI